MDAFAQNNPQAMIWIAWLSFHPSMHWNISYVITIFQDASGWAWGKQIVQEVCCGIHDNKKPLRDSKKPYVLGFVHLLK